MSFIEYGFPQNSLCLYEIGVCYLWQLCGFRREGRIEELLSERTVNYLAKALTIAVKVFGAVCILFLVNILKCCRSL